MIMTKDADYRQEKLQEHRMRISKAIPNNKFSFLINAYQSEALFQAKLARHIENNDRIESYYKERESHSEM